MLKWTLRFGITLIDIVLLIILWMVAGQPNVFAWFHCEPAARVAAREQHVDTIVQATGAMDNDMSGE